MAIRFLTKQQMVEKLRDIAKLGWVKSVRPSNAGGIGNTIDGLIGLPENNLPIADTAQWEMKTHRIGSSSLLTLLHMEPEPRRQGVVTKLLLPKYGWPDETRVDELSFRQTIQAPRPSDRGFGLSLKSQVERLVVYFDHTKVDKRHADWLQSVKQRAGLGPLDPEPYWQFKELFLKASTKLLNTFYVQAEAIRDKGEEYFRLLSVQVLQSFDIDRFIDAVKQGAVLVDFDARSHHNHGTKFRLRQEMVPRLYPLYRRGSVRCVKVKSVLTHICQHSCVTLDNRPAAGRVCIQ